jgi:hypothetical protein
MPTCATGVVQPWCIGPGAAGATIVLMTTSHGASFRGVIFVRAIGEIELGNEAAAVMHLRVSKVNPGSGWDTLGEEGELLLLFSVARPFAFYSSSAKGK